VDDALRDLSAEFFSSLVDNEVLERAVNQVPVRIAQRTSQYSQTVRISQSSTLGAVNLN
jgi:hypothetical protein